jgi:hypothetical protein
MRTFLLDAMNETFGNLRGYSTFCEDSMSNVMVVGAYLSNHDPHHDWATPCRELGIENFCLLADEKMVAQNSLLSCIVDQLSRRLTKS